jgi:branched-chain amino acid transport system substrate-binding protein
MKLRNRFLLSASALALLMALVGCGDTAGGGTAGGTTTGTTGDNAAATGSGAGATASRPEMKGEGNKAEGDKIILGLVASENGELRPWGIDSVKGAQLAVDEFNKLGGVNGKKVELRIGDSASKPEQGKSATDKLIGDGALCILGEVASGITAQMAQSCFEKGVPLIAIGATRTDITSIGNNIFRVCYRDDFQGPVMAYFAYNDLGLRKVALMTDKKQPYSTGLSDAFRSTFVKLGGEIVDEEQYESGQTQFTAQITNMKAKNPDGVFASGYFNEVGPIARQMYEAGMKDVKLMGGDGWDSSEILVSGGKGILGGYFCNHYNNKEDRPEVGEFLAKWKAKYPDNPVPATTMGALAYDAAMLACDALKRAASLDSKALREAIDNTESFKGVSGTIALKGNNGDPPKRALVVKLTPEGQVFAKAYEPSDITTK